MSGRRVAAALAALLLFGTACQRAPAGSAADPLAEARQLVDQGRYDEAIARLGAGGDAESLYLLGRAWGGKAVSAPVPTPAPGSPGPSAALLKPEEAQALDFLGRAVGARPDHAAAHLAIADLLAPHALALAATGSRAAAPPAVGADVSVERVLHEYADAIQADPAGITAVEGLIRFATQAGRTAEADGAYQELVRRRREDPSVLVRYGDFLAGPAGRPDDALAQYAQALIWRPDDTATRLKMAGIHLAAAAALLGQQQYAAAEVRLRDARRFTVDPASAQAARLRELEGRLREIRGR